MTSEKKMIHDTMQKSWAPDEDIYRVHHPVRCIRLHENGSLDINGANCNVLKILHYLQRRNSILVIADTTDIAHACIRCTTSPNCMVILQQHQQIQHIQTETVVPWLSDAITCYHKVQLLCVGNSGLVDVFLVSILMIIDFL